ncbi:hypothetical protein FB451DRAFT_1557023 [Mycena latifolia]|nr:hypothetical protein FB451DRAFT_1557023 [Mycena latifolia]
MIFPQELMDMILGEVKASGDGTETFRSFSLVAHRFLASSQRYLFRALTVERWSTEKLSWILEDVPHLASYVLDLTFNFDIGERGSYIESGVHDNDVCSALVSIFTVLGTVKRLSLPYFSADSLPAYVKCAFIRFLSLPSLEALVFAPTVSPPLRASGIPASLMTYALFSCKEVALDRGGSIYIDKFPQFIPIPALPPPLTPQTLDLHIGLSGIDNTLTELLLSPALAQFTENIEHLKISVGSQYWSFGRYRELRCLRTLRHLELRVFTRTFSLKSLGRSSYLPEAYTRCPIELPALPCLRRLTLRAPVRNLEVPDSVLSIISRLVAGAPGLKDIVVILSLTPPVDEDIEAYVDSSSTAIILDAALAQLEHLRNATFSVNGEPAVMASFARWMEARFYRTQAAGRLAVVRREGHDDAVYSARHLLKSSVVSWSAQ